MPSLPPLLASWHYLLLLLLATPGNLSSYSTTLGLRGLLRKLSLLRCPATHSLAHSYSSSLTHLRNLPSQKAFPAPKFGANSSPVLCSPCSASFVHRHLFATISSTQIASFRHIFIFAFKLSKQPWPGSLRSRNVGGAQGARFGLSGGLLDCGRARSGAVTLWHPAPMSRTAQREGPWGTFEAAGLSGLNSCRRSQHLYFKTFLSDISLRKCHFLLSHVET